MLVIVGFRLTRQLVELGVSVSIAVGVAVHEVAVRWDEVTPGAAPVPLRPFHPAGLVARPSEVR